MRLSEKKDVANSDADANYSTPRVDGGQSAAVEWIESLPATYIISVISAANAELVTYPLDLVKTRLQIQGEGSATQGQHKTRQQGMLKTTIGIIREEGPLKLWGGILPMLYRHAIYSGMRLVIYDFLRKKYSAAGDGKALPVWESALFGCTAGALAQWMASPTDLVKVQMQMEGKRRSMGETPRILSANHAFKDILRRGGVRGLWKGSVPNMQRAALITLGDISAYDVSKQLIMEKLDQPDGHLVHFLGALCAGFCSSILGTPADVIKSRVMNQPTDEMGRGLLYRGSLDCLRQTVNREGLFALYKGFLPCWLRLAPWAMVFWITFEQIRHVLGASSY